MDIDVLDTIDLIFDSVIKSLSEGSGCDTKQVIEEARMAVKMITMHTFTDNGDIINALTETENVENL